MFDQELVRQVFLNAGIENPYKIKFEDEDGIIKEHSWNELSAEERQNILSSTKTDPERDLDDNEIELINTLRRNKLTPQQFVDYYKDLGAKQYAASLDETPQYSVSQLTDDELFVLDLQNRVEDITDEEALNLLEQAKQNQTLFAKQVAGIRADYTAKEQEQLQIQAYEQQQREAENFNRFKDSILTNIQSLNRIGELDINLDDNDASDLASFILDTDETGVSYLGRALNDPETLVQMAWFALNGEKAFNTISDYISTEIKKVGQANYNKGYEDGLKKQRNNPRVVVTKPQKQSNYDSYLDLDF